MLPLLAVALLIWAGVMTYLFVVERKVSTLERKLDELNARPQETRI
jgi:hypothetical protein